MEPRKREGHLLDYWRILIKRRWVVMTSLVVVVSTVTLGSLLQVPIYTATARLQIERAAPNVLPFQELMTSTVDYRKDFYETQYALIRSRRVARDTIRSLRLDRHPAFRLEAKADPTRDLSAEEVAEATRISILLGGIQVSSVRNSQLVDISYSAPDPVLAAQIANRVAETYIAFNSEARYNTTERATTSLAHQVANLQEEIDLKEKELQDYARQHGIVLISEKQNIALKNLEDLSDALTRARADRIEKEARFVALRDSDPGDLEEVIGNKLIQDLTARLADREREHASLSEKYKPDWPEMVRLRSEMGEIRRSLENEKEKLLSQVLGAAEAAYRAALGEERQLEGNLEKAKGEYQDLGVKEIQYNNLKAEIANRRATLEALAKRQTETSSSIGLNEVVAGNVRIVDPAEPPSYPSAPRTFFNIFLAVFSGLGMGVGWAFFLEYLDKSIKTPEDLQDSAGIPCIGLIPGMRGGGNRLRPMAVGGGRRSAPPVELITHRNLKADVSEAFREMRTSLLVSRPGGPPKTILVTSSQPGEGKTVVALNVAITLAQVGRRVLVVDADLRKPRLADILEIEPEKGMTHYLSGAGEHPMEPQKTSIDGLDVVTSGPLPPNPADLLDSERFVELQAGFLALGYHHIVYDSPPVLAVADPAILAGRVEAVLMVVWAGVTDRDTVRHAVERLEQVKAPLVGGVLNQLTHSHQGYYGYRYKKYYGKKETVKTA